MKWKINIFTYLEVNFLLKLFFEDKVYFSLILKEIIREYYLTFNKPIICDNLILQFINIFPQIQYFQTEHLSMKHEIIRIDSSNKYILNGNPNDELIYSNYILPHPSNSCIPFTVGIVKDLKFKLINSDIFYFEVSVDSEKFRKPFLNESLLIGFTNADDDIKNINFGSIFSFGLNFVDNRLEIEGNHIYLSEPIFKGDHIGLGLKYLENYNYELFVTLNGRVLNIDFYNNLEIIRTTSFLKIIANINISHGVNFNFGNREYKFDLENFIFSNRIRNFTNHNFINRGYDLTKIKTDYFVSSNKSYIKEYIYNLIPNTVNLFPDLLS